MSRVAQLRHHPRAGIVHRRARGDRRGPVPAVPAPARRPHQRRDPGARLRRDGARAQPRGRVRRAARPRLRRLLRLRPDGHRLVGVRLLLVGQRREGHPRRHERLRVEPARHPPQLPAADHRRDRHLRDRGRADRPADAAPARRLHRDRDAGLRRDHRPRVRQRRRDHDLRRQQALQRPPVDRADRPDQPAVLRRVRLGAEPAPVLLDRARARAGGAVRELPPARLAARPRLDRAARGRGGRGQHGRAAREDQAALLRRRRRVRRHLRRVPRARSTTASTPTSSSSASRSSSSRW